MVPCYVFALPPACTTDRFSTEIHLLSVRSSSIICYRLCFLIDGYPQQVQEAPTSADAVLSVRMGSAQHVVHQEAQPRMHCTSAWGYNTRTAARAPRKEVRKPGVMC